MVKKTNKKEATSTEQAPVEATPVTKTTENTTRPGKRLIRSTTDKMVSGVCAGLAQYFDIDPTIVRLIFVGLTVWGGSGILIYIVLAIVLPEEANYNKSTQEVVKENAKQFEETVERVANNVETAAKERNTQLWIGVAVIILGFVLMGSNYGMFDIGSVVGMFVRTLWPLFIIGIGLLILTKSQNGK